MSRIILALAVLMSVSAQASLPPYADQLVKLKTVLESEELSDLTSVADKIVSVTEVKTNVFAVQMATYSCTYLVNLEALESKDHRVGPTVYRVTSVELNGCERP